MDAMTKPTRVRIKADGLTSSGVSITTDTGQDITTLVSSVKIELDPGEPNRVTLGAYADKLDVLCEVVGVVDVYPHTVDIPILQDGDE